MSLKSNNKNTLQTKTQVTKIPLQSNKHYAVIDLGSNSFHMLISEYDGQTFHQIGKFKEKVQLASGLDEDDKLSETAIERGLKCLRIFSERIKEIPTKNISVVATYTLRKAVNRREFIDRAEKILKLAINILPGSEEARLIYTGVSHNHPDIEEALVIDIGGGSTEIILGNKFHPIELDSLSIGCVTYKKYFPNGVINHFNLSQAILNAAIEISPVGSNYISDNWRHCLGASGSIQAVHYVLKEFGFDTGYITYSNLLFLKEQLIAIGNIEDIQLKGLSQSRKSTFATGVAILIALFQELKINKMYLADASLREGAMLEMEAQLKGLDIRNQTIQSLINRFNIDKKYAQQVKFNAQLIYQQLSQQWNIDINGYQNLLNWSCLLHEIGLAISFADMRAHSAYIIEHADMPGFSQQTKDSLSAVLASQKKKLYLQNFEHKFEPAEKLTALAQILRLSILFNIKRNNLDIKPLQFIAQDKNGLLIKIPTIWAEQHQLIMAELDREKKYLTFNNIEFNWEFF